MPDKIQVSACLLGLAVAFPGMAAASIIESAIDVSGQTGFVDFAYGDHTINGSIAIGVTNNNFRFQGNAGDQIRFIVSSGTPNLDPLIELRDASGTLLKAASCNGKPSVYAIQCSANLDQTLAGTGTYYLNLSETNADESGNYTLSLEQRPPATNWDAIAYGTPLSEQLGHAGDTDFLAFNGLAGTGVKISFASTTPGLDPSLEVWDPLGNLVESTWCNGKPSVYPINCSVVPALDLLETGTYRIGLSDYGWDEIGGYNVGVSCLYGDCPSS
ncbi:MAG TPA: hypothetical protein ENI83_03250, partial [Gammaproteobacteria bacterium]|nr:hypothetical protein [Gammaproteobacteria bacterium]